MELVIAALSGVLLKALVLVTPASNMEPPEEDLNKEQEQDGGEGVPLVGASGDRDGGCESMGCDEAGLGRLIEAMDDLPEVLWEAKELENLLQPAMVHCAEGSCEVNVHEVDVLVEEVCILNGIHQVP